MDVKRFNRRLKALAEDPANLTELGRLARDLGHSLPTATLQELREFRADSAEAQDDLEKAEFAKGMLFGLIEVAAAYDAEIQAISEREELRRFICQEVHFGVLRQLEDGPRLPRDLALVLSTSHAQISRALRDLRALGLIDLMAPAALDDQRTRPHRLTPEGRALLQTLGEEPSRPGATRESVEVTGDYKPVPGWRSMELISFAKNVGRRLGLGDDEKKGVPVGGMPHTGAQGPSPQEVRELHDRRKAAAMAKVIEGMGFKVSELGVRVDDDKVTLTGQAASQSDREKIVLLVGNHEGIGAVDDRMTVAKQEPEAQYYEVKKGDTLSKIAKEHYGNANKYMVIFEANKPMLTDPDEIYPGLRLRIPARAKVLA